MNYSDFSWRELNDELADLKSDKFNIENSLKDLEEELDDMQFEIDHHKRTKDDFEEELVLCEDDFSQSLSQKSKRMIKEKISNLETKLYDLEAEIYHCEQQKNWKYNEAWYVEDQLTELVITIDTLMKEIEYRKETFYEQPCKAELEAAGQLAFDY